MTDRLPRKVALGRMAQALGRTVTAQPTVQLPATATQPNIQLPEIIIPSVSRASSSNTPNPPSSPSRTGSSSIVDDIAQDENTKGDETSESSDDSNAPSDASTVDPYLNNPHRISREEHRQALQEAQKELKEHSDIKTRDFGFSNTGKMAEAAETTGSSLEERITTPADKSTDADAAKPDLGGDGAGDAHGGSELQEPDYSVEVKLSDLQADPHNPLFSVKTFEDLGLDSRVLEGLTAMNFRKPSKVQERALPLLMANPPTNLVGQSQSGTGKTAAFVLNILSRIDLSTDQSRNTPQALILAPTRELARQIVGVISIMGRFLDGLVVGTAVPMGAADRPSRLMCSVVVGTPGTVQEMMKKRILNPTQLKVLVLDEADNMLDLQGLGDQCIRVKSMLPKTIQVVLFSATFPAHVYRYAQTFAPNANEITLKHEELTVDGIKQLYMDCDSEEEKYTNLVQLYGLLTVGSSIIFVRTRESAREIERRMVAEGHTVASLTGGVEGSQRDAVIDAFRSGEAKVLITTNVLARGIDVSTVSLVINYDIPEEHEQSRSAPKQLRPDYQTYLHRIGRTGRFGRIGVAITFVANRDEWEMLRMIQQHFSCRIERIDTNDWDEVEQIIKKTIKNTRAQAKFSFV